MRCFNLIQTLKELKPDETLIVHETPTKTIERNENGDLTVDSIKATAEEIADQLLLPNPQISIYSPKL